MCIRDSLQARLAPARPKATIPMGDGKPLFTPVS